MKHQNWSRFFKDKDGKWTIVQLPNPPLWIWIVLTVSAPFLHGAATQGQVNILKNMILFAWAYTELRYGNSSFRKVLGGIVICGLVIGVFVI